MREEKTMRMIDQATRDATEGVARRSYGKLVAYLAARTRDVAAAEDALAEHSRRRSPTGRGGIPRARKRGCSPSRGAGRSMPRAGGARRGSAKISSADRRASWRTPPRTQTTIPDQRLALMFACAHPAIDPGVRAPLILQTVLGFDAADDRVGISRGARDDGPAPGARKEQDQAGGHSIPRAGACRPGRTARCGARRDLRGVRRRLVRSGRHATRAPKPDEEGIWLGRLVASLLPDEPEALGLLALMLHAEARRAARRRSTASTCRSPSRTRPLWDAALIDEAEALLRRASACGVIGRYQLEAAVQSAHATRRITGRTDWAAMEELYDALLALTGSPVVAINRAVAIAETQGAAAGLAALDALSDDARLAEYQPYWAARAGLLARIGRRERSRPRL